MTSPPDVQNVPGLLAKNEREIDATQLARYFLYDRASGLLTWRALPRNATSAAIGSIAGYLTKNGRHRYVKLAGRRIMAHRICWFLHYKTWPAGNLDHINGNGSDNRISNLRIASHSENNANRGPQKNNKTGFKGVSFDKKHGKFLAKIMWHGKQTALGYFGRVESASRAYKKAAKKLHGEFANHG